VYRGRSTPSFVFPNHIIYWTNIFSIIVLSISGDIVIHVNNWYL
jgi:hypothetical protein